jgi:hypothetical protein
MIRVYDAAGNVIETRKHKGDFKESLIQNSKNAVRFSPARTTKRYPSSRRASAIQIVRPSQSMAETMPQLHPVC